MARPPAKAQRLADELAELVRSGELTGWLPAERQLAEKFAAGRSTVRQAVRILADRGLVEHVGGLGSRIRPGGRAARDIAGELHAIRGELRGIDARLAVIEGHLSP